MNISKNFLLTILIGAFTLCIVALNGQSKTEELDALLTKYYEYGKFSGSVLIAEEGEVIYKKGFGFANHEWDIPNEPNTKHRLGSITKQFTGMLILQQVAQGKLDLQAPITKYLPDYPSVNGDKITTHHLLTHSSGLPNYTNEPGFFANDSRDPFTPEEFLEKFQDKALEFEPGETFSYSNSGYFLLGVILEKVSDKSYEQLIHDDIFTPLGMKDSGYDNHEDILKNRASGYQKIGMDYYNASYLDMSIPYAAGSLYSTVEDMYLWDQALYTDKLVPQKFMDMYFEPEVSGSKNFNYAFGWGIGKERIGNTEEMIDVITHEFSWVSLTKCLKNLWHMLCWMSSKRKG